MQFKTIMKGSAVHQGHNSNLNACFVIALFHKYIMCLMRFYTEGISIQYIFLFWQSAIFQY